MKNGKLGRVDGKTAEILKADIETTAHYLAKLLLTFWNQETMPSVWNKGLIVDIPKKGDRSICDNDIGIKFCLAAKCSRILIQRIQEGVEKQLREKQSDLRRGQNI